MNSSTVPDNRDVFDIREKICNGSFGSTIFKACNAAVGHVAIAKKYPAAITNDYEVTLIHFFIFCFFILFWLKLCYVKGEMQKTWVCDCRLI